MAVKKCFLGPFFLSSRDRLYMFGLKSLAYRRAELNLILVERSLKVSVLQNLRTCSRGLPFKIVAEYLPVNQEMP